MSLAPLRFSLVAPAPNFRWRLRVHTSRRCAKQRFESSKDKATSRCARPQTSWLQKSDAASPECKALHTCPTRQFSRPVALSAGFGVENITSNSTSTKVKILTASCQIYCIKRFQIFEPYFESRLSDEIELCALTCLIKF